MIANLKKKINKFEHSFIKHNKKFNKKNPIFTIGICTYKHKYLFKTLNSVVNQTYENLEIIILDHGAIFENKQVYKKFIKKKNIAIVEIKKNYGIENTMNVWNFIPYYCKGEYIFILNDDDYISKNFAQKMVDLFLKNENCVTAAPLPVSVNKYSKVNHDYSLVNMRPRYISGLDVALNFMNSWMDMKALNFYFTNHHRKKYYVKKFLERYLPVLFLAPGGIMTIKRDLLIKYGGYDFNNDDTQLLKYSVLGDTGYDPKAKLFWRHHYHQNNKISERKGDTYYVPITNSIKESGYFDYWKKNFSRDNYLLLKKYTNYKIVFNIQKIIISFIRKRSFITVIKIFYNVLVQCPLSISFLIFYKTFIKSIYFFIKFLNAK
jgi:glycosyltransferase involved in cell wall biosynthesis